MKTVSSNIVAISYAKRALTPGTRERARMQAYATVFDAYHLIVFTRASEKFPALQQEGTLFLHATNAHSKIGMLVQAFLIGRRIVTANREKSWVVSGQDPFATSVVTLALSFFKNTALHVQVHGDSFNEKSYEYIKGLFGIARIFFGAFIVNRAKKVRVVSERIKKTLLDLRVKEERIVVVPIQADLEAFLKVGAQRTYGQSAAVTILYVGRFSSEKNVPLLLDAFAQVLKTHPTLTLQLLGEGTEQKKLQKKCAALHLEDRVVFLPWTNDVPAIMAAADVFCLSSLHEGFAMVLVEAMAAGLPVVTTEVGCVGEVMQDDEHGVVVPVDDKAAYAEALQRLVENPLLRERYGRAGHVTAQGQTQSTTEYLHAIQASFSI